MSFHKDFNHEFRKTHGTGFLAALFESLGTIAGWYLQGAMMALGAYVALSYVGFIK